MGLLDVFRKKKEEEWPEQMLPSSDFSEIPAVPPSAKLVYRGQPAFSSPSVLVRKRPTARKRKKPKTKPARSKKRGGTHRKSRVRVSPGRAKMTRRPSPSRLASLSRNMLQHTHLKRSVIKNLGKSKGGQVISGPKGNMLDDALSDLGKELRDLHSSRRTLNQLFVAASSELEKVQARKVKWQTQIATASEKETKLMKKKAAAKDKMMALDQKIQKVKSIERELKEV